MRRPVLLAAGVTIALSIALLAARSGHTPSVAANIGAKPNAKTTAKSTGQPTGQATAGAYPTAGADPIAVAERPDSDDQLSLAPAAPPAEPMLGDGHLSDVIDIKQARLINDAFYIPLPDGKRAVLTLDHALQEAAEAALAKAQAPKAAIVLMSVDGRILALAGREGKKSAPDLATRVWAPAASVFKIVTSAALVEAGVGTHDRVCYHGGVRSVVASNLTDDPKRDRRCNDLTFAIAHSQNAIIAKLAHKHLQPAVLRKMAGAFGIGDPPRFALAMEPGSADIPDAELDFAKVAAGFWQTELSPLGGAILATTVASGGLAVTPRIVDHVQRGEQSVAIEPVPDRRVLDQAVARKLARMMVETTESGTARKGFRDTKGRKFLAEVAVAGKTGTLTRRAPKYLQYSWFVGFAPADEPEYVIAVLIGNGELWHLKAHTAARMVLQAAF